MHVEVNLRPAQSPSNALAASTAMKDGVRGSTRMARNVLLRIHACASHNLAIRSNVRVKVLSYHI